jgi:cell division control protein 6
MSLFNDILGADESVFRDTVALDFDYQPKLIKYRENEQRRFALAIKPLLHGSNGRNVFIHGPPGVGKTTACKHVLKELEEEQEHIIPIYINCWKENTTFKIITRICLDLGFSFLQNKRTGELFDLVKKRVNKQSAVFVFDEIDKVEDLDFLYIFLEDIYRKSIFLITNYQETFARFDERIRSRLGPEFVFFDKYTPDEIEGILRERRGYAFQERAWDEEAFARVVGKTAAVGDVRLGLYLMREAGLIAEEKSSRTIGVHHVDAAINRADTFSSKNKEELDDTLQNILQLVKKSKRKKIGDLYAAYTNQFGEISYKTFQRKISKLKEGGFISTEKVTDNEGNTTIITHHKKLTEF